MCRVQNPGVWKKRQGAFSFGTTGGLLGSDEVAKIISNSGQEQGTARAYDTSSQQERDLAYGSDCASYGEIWCCSAFSLKYRTAPHQVSFVAQTYGSRWLLI
jgi:hypothetical protein